MISVAHAAELAAKRVRNEGLRKRERAKIRDAKAGVVVARAQAPRAKPPKAKTKAKPGMTVAEARALGSAIRAELATAQRRKVERAQAKAQVAFAMGRGPRPAETRGNNERLVARLMGVPLDVLRK